MTVSLFSDNTEYVKYILFALSQCYFITMAGCYEICNCWLVVKLLLQPNKDQKELFYMTLNY